MEGQDNQENILVGLCEQDLPNLINLVVFNCKQSGQIPVGISKFKKLVDLDLSSNLLSGTIPTTIGDLTNLELLNFSHNCLEGTIPTQLEKLTRLDQLVLAHNQLEGQVSFGVRQFVVLPSAQQVLRRFVKQKRRTTYRRELV